MSFRLQWDPAKAATNAVRHGVTFTEAATAFGDPLGYIIPDPRHSAGEDRLVLLGRSLRGRLLAVMFTERGDALRLISARPATRRERRDHEEGFRQP
jgi:uncharacterized DUF497 family protein